MVRRSDGVHNDLKDRRLLFCYFRQMAITWRRATWVDVEPSLSLQVRSLGDRLVGAQAAVESWRRLLRHPFFTATVLESSPLIGGHRLIGFGASIVVSRSFADAETANPQPDINSRVIASVHSGQAALATRSEVARANAGEGINLVVLYGVWRDKIMNPAERQEAQTLLASSFTERHGGYRIRRILHETVDDAGRQFTERSVIFEEVAAFPSLGRVLFSMTRESVQRVPGSLGNLLFSFCEPVLHLRDSDQELLTAALSGATDQELSVDLSLTLAAIKARWRSTFARIEETAPALVSDIGEHEFRGSQKRHRVLAYVRSHPEELRPYDWKVRLRSMGETPGANGAANWA